MSDVSKIKNDVLEAAACAFENPMPEGIDPQTAKISKLILAGVSESLRAMKDQPLVKACPQCGMPSQTELVMWSNEEMCSVCKNETITDEIEDLEAKIKSMKTHLNE